MFIVNKKKQLQLTHLTTKSFSAFPTLPQRLMHFQNKRKGSSHYLTSRFIIIIQSGIEVPLPSSVLLHASLVVSRFDLSLHKTLQLTNSKPCMHFLCRFALIHLYSCATLYPCNYFVYNPRLLQFQTGNKWMNWGVLLFCILFNLLYFL